MVAKLAVGLVTLIHIYILWLEMFGWMTRGPKVFKSVPADNFAKTREMAGNQGLYNGFLAAGLIWSLIIADPVWSRNVALFFLGCVAIAGIYGAATVQRTILVVQTVPALIALALIVAGK
jgi:putative membrane protein